MSHGRIAILVFVLVLVIIIGVFVLSFLMREREIKIGFVSPTSGPVREVGLHQMYSAQVAIDEQNAKGGIDGKKIVLIPVDGQCSEEGGKSAAEYLINTEKVKFILGGTCSDETLGIASVSEPAGVTVLSYLATNPSITTAGDHVFRTVPSDAINARNLAKYAVNNGQQKRFVVMSGTSAYTRGFATSFTDGVKESGGEVVEELIFPEGTLNFDTYIDKLEGLEFDAVVISGSGEAVIAQLIRALRDKGIMVPLYGGDALQDMDFRRAIGENVGEVFSITTPSLNMNDARVKNFFKLYDQKNLSGKADGGVGLAYDAAEILMQAIAAVGNDAEKVKKYFYTMPVYSGILGSYAFDENGDVKGFNNVIVKYDSNTHVLTPVP